MAKQFTKQPSENLDYDFDYSAWIEEGDSLASSVVTVSSGITAGSKIDNITEGIVKQWLSGGTDGQDYLITCRITTQQSRIKEAEMVIRVRELRAFGA